MNTSNLLNGLRFVDSFFPSGGYAFSSGLEAAVQGGAVRNAEMLSRYVTDLLRSGLGPREAVAVGQAHRAAETGALQVALLADGELDAMKIGRESRLASRQMGRHVIRIAGGQPGSPPILRQFLAAVEAEQSPGHLPISLGLTLGAFGWAREETIAAYLYQASAGLVSAGLKLLPMGQQEGQRLLESWLSLIGSLSREASLRTEMSAWSPIQDIYAMQHGGLTMRLFRS
jgi:urease accessory protein